MAFQRSYSKVWWGSDDNQFPVVNVMNTTSQHMLNKNDNTVSFTCGGLYSCLSQRQQHQQFGGRTYHSLDLNQYKSYDGHLSRIQEVEDENNISKISWEKQDSPGSLKSHDSGFSDNDEFQNIRASNERFSKTATPEGNSVKSSKSNIGSPSSVHSAPTPPTVIRRVGNSEFYTSLVNVSRRISFSCSATPNRSGSTQEQEDGSSLMDKINSMQLMTESPVAKKLIFDDSNITQNSDTMSPMKENNYRVKRRKKVQRKATSPLSQDQKRLQNINDETDEENRVSYSSVVAEYNNETVFLGESPPPPYNNETVVFGNISESSCNNTLGIEDQCISPLHLHTKLNGNTSTPKKLNNRKSACNLLSLFPCQEYNNTLLEDNRNVRTWLEDLRMCYDHEVMSTLQTKSIAQEAFKNLKITTSTVAKFVRQLQQKALSMQGSIEKVESMLSGAQNVSLHDALTKSLQLVDHVSEFTLVLERRSVFFADSRLERKRYEDYLDQIRIVNKDTRYSLENHHYINLESLLEDLQVLKRTILISLQQVYGKLIRILVMSIENSHCDLMLKANLNMIATLMNIDYNGFASLTKAFVETEAVRSLLVVCLDHKLTSVRAQALRALTNICCAPETIAQLDSCGGIEVIRDILQVDCLKKRSEMEKREAVSLLTQITAAWHGPHHKVTSIKSCVESVIEGLTRLLISTECPQTLLLSTAALNNLSRIEITSHYSIMSHETILKLITIMLKRDKGINVFLYEQIVGMLYNMSLNKKCHTHLANAGIINFITYAYQTEFYKSYNSRGETEAQERCIKTILHILTRLMQDSVLGMELLEHQKHILSPLILKQQLPSLDTNSSREIPFLAHELSSQVLNYRDRQSQAQQLHPEIAEKGKKLHMQLKRQESYV